MSASLTYTDVAEAFGLKVEDLTFELLGVDMAKPELPPECWNTEPIDPDRAMAAVRAMCGEGKK